MTEKKPPTLEVQRRRLVFARALERLLLVSTSGAFFFALARNLPTHVAEFHLPPDWVLTLDRVLRYLYLLWFLAYFFVSSVNNDLSDRPRSPWDLLFDVVQSFTGLTAAYFLGFVIPTSHGTGWALGAANTGIALVCTLALILFHRGPPQALATKLNPLRWAGLALSVFALALILAVGPSVTILWILLGVQLVLWWLWLQLLLLRLSTSADTEAVAPASTAAETAAPTSAGAA